MIRGSVESIAEQVAMGVELERPQGFFRPRRLLFAADVLSALLAGLLAYGILQIRGSFFQLTTVTAVEVTMTGVIALGMLARAGQYANRRRISPLSDAGVLLRGLIIAFAATSLLSYLTKGFFTGFTSPSRLAVGSFAVAFLLLGIVSRICLNAYQRHLFAQGRGVRKILVLGAGVAAADFLDFVEMRPWLGVAVAGRVAYGTGDGPSDSASTEDGSVGENHTEARPSGHDLPIIHLTNDLPGLKRLDETLRASGATEVVVALDPEDQAPLSHIAELLAVAHVPFKVIPSLFSQSYRSTELLGYAEIPVIDVEVDPLDRTARLFKRMLDVFVGLCLLILLLPLELLVVVAIVAESGLPVFYKQERVGKNARHFQMYKFRTMIRDADQHLAELQSKNEAGSDGRMFKIHHDPRVTRVGAVLRKFSVDELPQLINVLKRDMSMVGPRPPLPAEVKKYEREHIYRLKALPGITGLWQVSGRSDLDFQGMVKLDRYYLDNWSILMDIRILVRTVFVVVGRKGAY
jgi:exopolysaccharide biosynthesis polyprenyl glycosylphosphotransferase